MLKEFNLLKFSFGVFFRIGRDQLILLQVFNLFSALISYSMLINVFVKHMLMYGISLILAILKFRGAKCPLPFIIF